MVNIDTVIQYLYPTARRGIDYLVEERSGVQVIAFWSSAVLGPQPSQATLAANELLAAKAQREKYLRDSANAWYTSSIREFEGMIVNSKNDTGAVMTSEETQIRDAVQANYQTLRTKITTVRNATTVAQVEAVVW